MNTIAHHPPGGSRNVIEVLRSHVESDRYRDVSFIEIGDVENKRAVVAGMDEAQPR